MPIAESVLAGLLVEGGSRTVDATYGKLREHLGADDVLAETFETELTDRLESRAGSDALDSAALVNLCHYWDEVSDVMGTEVAETAFATEKEAVDTLVDAAAAELDGELDDAERETLREVIAEAHREAVAALRERAKDDEELQTRFQIAANAELLDRLEAFRQSFDRLATRGPFESFEFPAEREAVVERVLRESPDIEFAERPDVVPEPPEPARRVVLGATGAGKTRVIGERLNRLPADAVETVIVVV